MKLLEYSGKLTVGYYNYMEAGCPVFIDGKPLSDIVKSLLEKEGMNSEFWYDCDYPWCDKSGGQAIEENPLVGKNVKLILVIEDED